MAGVECMDIPDDREFLEFSGVIPQLSVRNSISFSWEDMKLHCVDGKNISDYR